MLLRKYANYSSGVSTQVMAAEPLPPKKTFEIIYDDLLVSNNRYKI
jgi:hypothetical protein